MFVFFIFFRYQAGEHPTLSLPATVDLATMLPSPLSLTNVVELPLNGQGARTPVADLTRITLQPMQTRTFEVSVGAVTV